MIRNGGKDAEQIGLAAHGGCSQGWPITPLTLGMSCLGRILGISQKSLLCSTNNTCCGLFFFPLLFSAKVVPAGSIFPVQHWLMPEGTEMSQPWCAQLPFLRAEGWRRPQAQTNPPAIKTSWVLLWVGTTTGEYQLYQEFAQSSKTHRRDLCPS